MKHRGHSTITSASPTTLVTGAAGFVGSHLVEALLQRDIRVVGFDNFSTGSRQNLANALLQDEFTLIEGDIRDAKAVEEACKGCEVVFHLAAVTQVSESIRDPQKYTDINVTGTQNVLTGAVRAEVPRFLFASSAAVYGTPETVPIPEDSSTQPLSPYGSSKLQGEHLCHTTAANHEIIAPQLRLFNIYGPRQPSEGEAGVVSSFVNRAHQGLPLTIFGDGYQTRDFIYIDDVIEALIQAATMNSVSTIPINVGTGIPVSLRELAEAIQHTIPSCSNDIQFEPPRPGDIYHSVAQISRMQELLNFSPKYTLHEGLRRHYQIETSP